MTQGQVDSILRHLERDEATLLPHEWAFRDNVIRYLNGEVDFVSVFAEQRIPEVPSKPKIDPSVAPPIVDRPNPPQGHGTPLGASGPWGSSEGANKIDESSKPETPAKPKTLRKLLAGALLRSLVASVFLVVIALIFRHILFWQLSDTFVQLAPILWVGYTIYYFHKAISSFKKMK